MEEATWIATAVRGNASCCQISGSTYSSERKVSWIFTGLEGKVSWIVMKLNYTYICEKKYILTCGDFKIYLKLGRGWSRWRMQQSCSSPKESLYSWNLFYPAKGFPAEMLVAFLLHSTRQSPSKDPVPLRQKKVFTQTSFKRFIWEKGIYENGCLNQGSEGQPANLQAKGLYTAS